MNRSYEYQGFTVEVSVKTDVRLRTKSDSTRPPDYLAHVRIIRAGTPLAVLSPLRCIDHRGEPFRTEADALMGGYSAGQRVIDVFNHATERGADSFR